MQKYVSPNGYSDDYGPNVSQILGQGSRVISARIPARVRAELRDAVKDGVLGHLKRDGLKPEVFFHPDRKNEALSRQRTEAEFAIFCVKKILAGAEEYANDRKAIESALGL